MREIGVLLFVFGPIDAAYSQGSLDQVFGFLTVGVLFFVGSLILEWRSEDDA